MQFVKYVPKEELKMVSGVLKWLDAFNHSEGCKVW